MVTRGVWLLLGSSNKATGLFGTMPWRLPHLYAPLSADRALFIRLCESLARRIRPKALSRSAKVTVLARLVPMRSLS